VGNLRVAVNNAADQTEARNIMISLGYSPKEITCISCGDLGFLVNAHNENGATYKEITLPQLRDMVVLKRNDVGDANYETNYGTQCYITREDVYAFQDNKWFLSAMQHKDILDMIKPIEKPMKEYLRKNSNGTYSYIVMVQPENISQNVIEIPEGSETFNYYDGKDNLFFLKGSGEDTMFSNDLNDWDWKHWGNIDFDGVVCLWSRHTHPEELPFIDDEPLQSLNDQYAEIETVRQTLNQRQEQYGSFEDVAMITEQMVDVMRKGYYENLAYNQKMALYMICSKMARIVNGNPNHKDSWHDIAGYATLIDNELVSEKDMPF